MNRILCVASARPNFMKVKPIVDALEVAGLDVDLVHTGQHYDRMMSDVFFEDLGLRQPDVHLGVGSGSHAEQTAAVMVAFERLLGERRPDCVVVVGDVNPTLACAITAAKCGVSVAHVEAGLRSGDWSMPEEVNRVVADRVSDLLFAPSEDAVLNLRAEGYGDDAVHLVGNVMIDTLLANVDRALERETAARLGVDGRYGVVTLHRPSNVDDPVVFDRLLGALLKISTSLPLIFSVHPRTRERLAGRHLPPEILVSEPLGYLDFLCLQANAELVLTDSGGVQEETTVLGVPCLTLRENTERPITIEQGTNRLVGTTDSGIVSAASDVLLNGVRTRCPDLWDGRAASRVATEISRTLGCVDSGPPSLVS